MPAPRLPVAFRCASLRRVSDVTRILDRVQQGDPKAAEQLLHLVYEELRRLAACADGYESPGQTLLTVAVRRAVLRRTPMEISSSPDLAQANGLFARVPVAAARGRRLTFSRMAARLPRRMRLRRMPGETFLFAASHWRTSNSCQSSIPALRFYLIIPAGAGKRDIALSWMQPPIMYAT